MSDRLEIDEVSQKELQSRPHIIFMHAYCGACVQFLPLPTLTILRDKQRHDFKVYRCYDCLVKLFPPDDIKEPEVD